MHPEGRTLFISVRPRFAELLLTGIKTVELRRVQPTVVRGTPVLVYASSPLCALLATGVVDDLDVASHDEIWRRHGSRVGVSRDEYDNYFQDAAVAVAITLADVRRLPRPVPLHELRDGRDWFRPPQSFRYLNEQQTTSLGVQVPRPIPA